MKFDGSIQGDALAQIVKYAVYKDENSEDATLYIGTGLTADKHRLHIHLLDTEEGLRALAELFTGAADWYKENKRLEKELIDGPEEKDPRKST